MLAEQQQKWATYFTARQDGLQPKPASKLAGISPATAYRFERGEKGSSGVEAAQFLGITHIGDIRIPKALCPEAERGLTDFAYFRLRYFGRTSTPWQADAAGNIQIQLDSDGKEYVVINAPPGAGKSTLFTHDIPVWLICRNRSIRIMIGSRTQKQANKYVRRIRRTLERLTVMRADAQSLERGWAVDAVGVLADDYGAFASGRAELWTASEFTVLQDTGDVGNKESTVTAYGMDTDFLGGRFDFVIWDDLVDRKNTRSELLREELQERWDSEMEQRLEPGGLMVLQGQRIAAEDLYKYCLMKLDMDYQPVWKHIKYPAHFDELCTGKHSRDQPPWPQSCLLDPQRVAWEQLAPIRQNRPRIYKVIYQQEDMNADGVLIDQLWIDGGVDKATGLEYPGCKDHQRLLRQVPEHLKSAAGWSVVTVDPSPTQFWSVQWWAYHVVSEDRYLIDHQRGVMATTDFLTMDLDTQVFSGLLHDWVVYSRAQGLPITHVIVEQNAAQRFMLQNPIYQRWQERMGVSILPHDTHRNKTDPKFGVESLQEPYASGHYRLPYAEDPVTRGRVQDIVYELTHYPGVSRTDCLMANWFFEYSLHKVWSLPSQGEFTRPQWVKDGVSRGLSYGETRTRTRLFGRTA